MKVVSRVAHTSTDGEERPAGATYELADDSVELKLRLKDGLVTPAEEAAPVVVPDPAPQG